MTGVGWRNIRHLLGQWLSRQGPGPATSESLVTCADSKSWSDLLGLKAGWTRVCLNSPPAGVNALLASDNRLDLYARLGNHKLAELFNVFLSGLKLKFSL